jgi:uncharacterized membrane protein (DUF106 family)
MDVTKIRLSENKEVLVLFAALLVVVFATEGGWVALAVFLSFLNAFLLIQAVFPTNCYYLTAYLICSVAMIFMGLHFVVLAWALCGFVMWAVKYLESLLKK